MIGPLRRSCGRIAAVAGKELRHLARDRLTGGLIAGIPLMMTLLFGYAINNDVRNLRAAAVDHANTTASRGLLAAAAASQVLRFTHTARDEADLERLLARGDISVGLVIPADFEHRLARGRLPLGQMLVDGSDPVLLASARNLTRMPAATSGPPPDAKRRAETWALRAYYNPERRSVVFIVPGLCGVILTLTMVLFTATAIVRERERGNLELLIATPVRPLELMLGKIAPYVAIGYLQVSLILLLGVALFDVPLRGSMTAFFLGTGVFVISVLSLGLLISTVATSQFQAFQLTFITFLPQILLSGYMFPFEGMPTGGQWLAELFPLTHFLRIVRGILLRDATLPMMSGELWPLALFFLVLMSAATLRFRKRLD